jgi:S1/P1 Nuclease
MLSPRRLRRSSSNSTNILRSDNSSDHHYLLATTTTTTAWSHTALNLHHVWDDTFITTAMSESGLNGSRNALELDLMNDIWRHRQDWDKDDNNSFCPDGSRYECVNIWAIDSFTLAMQYAYADEHGRAIINGTTLSRAYYDSRIGVVRLQLAKAAYRLASTLESVLG